MPGDSERNLVTTVTRVIGAERQEIGVQWDMHIFSSLGRYWFLPAFALFGSLLLTELSEAQYCEALKTASAADAVNSLDRGEVHGGACARVAFQLIAHLPLQQATPILIKHLGYKWPWSNEPHGLHSDPAVEALADIGPAAEPAIIDFVGQHENENDIEYANALEALFLIRHGDAVPAVRLLRQRSLAVSSIPAARRLYAAADYMLKKFCSPALRKGCEARLRQPES